MTEMGKAAGCARPIDIIVPVFRGTSQTRACIESVLASDCRIPFELVVVDDASPERAMRSWLRGLAEANRATLLENESNLGFVASVNRGMRLHPDRDVVLLNSDTVVALDWLDRLAACGASNPRAGTVTPFSNNATLCSFPFPFVDNPLPCGWPPARLQRAFAALNAGKCVEIPTGVGFCMLIARACLADVGYFDEDAYGHGYGEENDFCRRAIARGWRNLLCGDVFVFHEGGTSFGESAGQRQRQATEVLQARFPDYARAIESFVASDPIAPLREAVAEHVLRESLAESCRNAGSILHVMGVGGGAVRYVRDIIEAVHPTRHAHFQLFLQDAHHGVLEDVRTGWCYPVGIDNAPGDGPDMLTDMVCALNIRTLHLHALSAPSLAAVARLRHRGLRLVVTLHDIGFVWRDAFADWGKALADEEDLAWRASLEALLSSAYRVLAPSRYIATRFNEVFPDLPIPQLVEPPQRPSNVPLDLSAAERDQIADCVAVAEFGDGPRVAVVGALGRHKGLEYWRQVTRIPSTGGAAAIGWVLIGYADDGLYPGVRDGVIVHGVFEPEQLAALLGAYAIDLVYFPLGMPEGFCFALSDVWSAGWPVVVHDHGALSERVRAHPEGGWLLPVAFSAQETADAIGALLADRALVQRAATHVRSEARSWFGEQQAVLRELEEVWMDDCEAHPAHEEAITAFQNRIRLAVDDPFFRAELRRTSSDNVFLSRQNEALKTSIDELQALAGDREAWANKLERDIAELRAAVEQLRLEKAALLELNYGRRVRWRVHALVKLGRRIMGFWKN